MAENKKSFVLYCDLIHNIDHLTNEEKGILLQHLLEYVNDLDPILEDRLILTAWKPIERQLKRDLKKFEDVKDVRSGLGSLGNLKRWNLDLYTKVQAKEITIKEALVIAKGRKSSLGDSLPSLNIANIAVNDNVNVNDINNSNTPPSPKAKGIDFDSLLMFLNLKTGKNFRIINKATRQKFNARLKDNYTKEDIRNAITNACKDTFHKESGFKFLNPDYFSRSQTLDSHAFKKIKITTNVEKNQYLKN